MAREIFGSWKGIAGVTGVASVGTGTWWFFRPGASCPNPTPIPGPSCGPDKIKPVAWLVADKWQFCGKQISFTDACKAHDDCYNDCSGSNGTHGKSKSQCDDEFHHAMRNECDDKLDNWWDRRNGANRVCKEIAAAYREGVERGGGQSYNESCRRRV